jgi:toxin ParE1/3/4
VPDLLILSLAQEDLKEIGRYTQQNWVRAFGAMFHDIRSGAVAGRQRADIRPGIMSCRCNRHVIFFRRDAAGTWKSCASCNQRMDFQRHL